MREGELNCTNVRGWIVANVVTLNRLLLTSLLLDILDTDCIEDIRTSVDRLPEGQDAVYQETIRRIEEDVQQRTKTIRMVLLWLVCSEEPITMDALRHAIAADSETFQYDAGGLLPGDEIVAMSRGLVKHVSETGYAALVGACSGSLHAMLKQID